MNDWQVQQIVDAIREHTRAMVAVALIGRAPKSVIHDCGALSTTTDAEAYAWASQRADALLAALSASSGGENDAATGGDVASGVSTRSQDVSGHREPAVAPEVNPSETQAATPPLSADLVTARARIAELEAQLGLKRMCVNCGKCKPAAEPQHEPLPECVGEDGLSACTFDTTPQEAWEYWRKRAHELEAQVREQREALKVARKAFNAMANEPIGPMDASDREVLQACEAVALDALAHPLIGGAK